MVRRSETSAAGQSAAPATLPAGAPNWVTEDLIELTLSTWQPWYKRQLTPEDALAIIMNVGRMFEVLSRGTRS
jgi:hypothetical protein